MSLTESGHRDRKPGEIGTRQDRNSERGPTESDRERDRRNRIADSQHPDREGKDRVQNDNYQLPQRRNPRGMRQMQSAPLSLFRSWGVPVSIATDPDPQGKYCPGQKQPQGCVDIMLHWVGWGGGAAAPSWGLCRQRQPSFTSKCPANFPSPPSQCLSPALPYCPLVAVA